MFGENGYVWCAECEKYHEFLSEEDSSLPEGWDTTKAAPASDALLPNGVVFRKIDTARFCPEHAETRHLLFPVGYLNEYAEAIPLADRL